MSKLSVNYSKFFSNDDLNTLRLLRKGSRFKRSMSEHFDELDIEG